MAPIKERILGALLAFFILPGSGRSAEPPPLAAFLSADEYRLPKLSPDGRRLAVIYARDFSESLEIIDPATMQVTPVARLGDLQTINFWWKGSDRVLLYVVDQYGTPYVRLLDLTTKKVALMRNFNRHVVEVVNPLINDPEHILVATSKLTGVDLCRFNVTTDKLEVLEKDPGFINHWLTDRDGRAVAAFGRIDDNWFMLTRSPTHAGWQRTELGKKSLPDFQPVAVYGDQRRILGFDYRTADTVSASLWDPESGTRQTIFHDGSADVASYVYWGDDWTRMRGIRYETDRARFHYLDPADDKLAAEIDAALPGTVNLVVSVSADESKMVIDSNSDSVPENYWLLDRPAKRLVHLGNTRPGLDPRLMAAGRYFVFNTHDGLQASGRLYLPPGRKQPPPLVVIVASDFDSRTYEGFDSVSQLLASRGYAIAEINHRGVWGFGRKFSAAGDEQIATGMPDDIADGVEFLKGQGLVDGKRIIVFSIYRGGVLALYALARHPGLFAGWINVNAPMTSRDLDVGNVIFGLHDQAAPAAELGGEDRAKRYVRSINPARLLPAVRFPSFHYYSRNDYDNALVNDGSKAERYFAHAGTPFVFETQPYYHHVGEAYEDQQRKAYEQSLSLFGSMLEFLDKYFPAAR
jgi:dipeptidyl aminopeptidase/acylaminoacyl peptidase